MNRNLLYFLLLFTVSLYANNQKLISGAFSGNLDYVQKILIAGADINTVDENGFTPLMWAIYNNHTQVARYLITNNAVVTTKNNQGYSPVLLAANNFNFELIVLLALYGADLKEVDKHGNTLLHYASMSGRKDFVEFLIGQHLNPNIPNNSNKYPVEYASFYGHKEVLDYFVQIGSYIPYKKYAPKTVRIPKSGSKVIDGL